MPAAPQDPPIGGEQTDGFGDWLRMVLNLPDAASDLARDIDLLHFVVIGTTMLGATAVAIVTLWFIVRYRRRGAPRPTPRVSGSPRLEWTVALSLLTLWLVWWGFGFNQYVRTQAPLPGSREVYVTAKQWMWKFAYPKGRESVGVLVVPARRPTRLLMTSRDVIHSFYIPNLRLKQDVLPGRYTSLWLSLDEPGVYPVYCAEYCGLSHSRMWASLVALAPEDYQRWLEGEVPPAVELGARKARVDVGALGQAPGKPMAERGRDLAERHGCFSCHTTDGRRHIGPTWRGLWKKSVVLASGEVVRADIAYITRSIMRPEAQVVAGYEKVMPSYEGLVTNAEVGPIVEFIKTLRDVEPEPTPPIPDFDVEGEQ